MRRGFFQRSGASCTSLMTSPPSSHTTENEIGPAHALISLFQRPCGARNVAAATSGACSESEFEPLIKVRQRVEKRGLLRQRKPSRRRRPSPRRRGFVDRAGLRDGDRVPGIAVGRMQPSERPLCRLHG